jgi:mannose-6-phosphate isomerase-like protein (cupin superfamily)
MALLGIGQSVAIPAVEVVLGRGDDEDSAAATTDLARIDQVAPFRLPPRRGDERVSRVRRDDAMLRPLVDLRLLTTPTAAGASLGAERVTYSPGAAMSVRRHSQIRVVSLEAGSLEAQIDGIAFLDRRGPAGSLLAREPHRLEGVVHLHPGDLLVVPAEAAFTTRNAGELPAVSLEMSVQLPLPLTPMTDRVRAGTGSGRVHREQLATAIASDPGVSAAVTVERITLSPSTSAVIDETTGPMLVLIEQGPFGATSDAMEVERAPGDVRLVPPGERATLRSNGEDPLAVLLLTVTPAEASSSAK